MIDSIARFMKIDSSHNVVKIQTWNKLKNKIENSFLSKFNSFQTPQVL